MMDANLEFHAVLDTFTEFLIVAIHQILHHRNIYPPYNFPYREEVQPPY